MTQNKNSYMQPSFITASLYTAGAPEIWVDQSISGVSGRENLYYPDVSVS